MFDEYTAAVITIILSGLFSMRAVIYILNDLE